MKETIIPISAIVGGGICVSASDGQRVYDVVRRSVSSGDRVILSFSGVTRMTTAFLNAAVGQLYGEFPESRIRERLGPPIEYEPWHLSRLKMVVDRAKLYFSDKEKIERILEENTGRHNDKNL
ncbi:STAS-like domain-containing protein [Pararhizobium sp. A13]|uniref:STAS-like domain-containing protein n=1 Tax=Pararhizobium sp. A13 TaxID=3133975 RepID=UPI003244BEBA